MGTSHQYTVLYEVDNRVESIYFNNWSSKPIIFRDVEPGQKNWIKYEHHMQDINTGVCLLEIHIKKIDDLIPGGFDHGKLGHGFNHELK